MKGPIAWMAKNSVAANLLMFVVFVGGCLGLFTMKQEVFPEFDLDVISIAVPYPGASPSDVEQGIVLAVEEAVRGVDGVKRVRSTSSESLGTVSVELLLGADADKVLNDVKSAVDRIQTFPEEAEQPQIALLSRKQEVISLILSGDQELGTLHALAEAARVGLLETPGITQVELAGVPPLEVSIEIPRETLESLGLTPELVAAQISAASLELPGGEIETKGGEILVRVSDRRRTAAAFADVVVKSTVSGADVRLGDIATLHDGYADTDQAAYFGGKPAVRVTVYRVGAETPTGVSEAVRGYATELRGLVPENVDITVWRDDSEMLAGRIDLLMRNARLGLVLVVLVLALLLDLRLAFWVAAGIPISFMGAFLLLPGLGLSINMVSLFAFIIVLGMVVDDAIVVGEAAHQKMQEGLPRMQAAVEGAREVAVPVTFGVLTTVAAFGPLFFIPGVMGKIFSIMPAVVICVLLFSMIESFFILPAHLGHGSETGLVARLVRPVDRAQRHVGRALDWWIETVYRPVLEAALSWRYVTLAGSVALLVATLGYAFAGHLPFSFFPKLEGDLVTASARLPYGVAIERTLDVRAELERAAALAVAENGGDAIVRGMFTRVGEGPPNSGQTGGHLVSVELNLVPSDDREVTSAEIAAAWLRNMPTLAGVEALVINSSVGPGAGAAVAVQISHPQTAVLGEVSAALAEELRTYPALTNIDNSFASGKPQLDFHLLPRARTLGLTSLDVARQLRSAFYGAEALREQRGRNELRVLVRLPEDQRVSEYDLEQLLIRTPGGGHVPLTEVAAFDRGRAPTTIEREDGVRVVDVTADLAPGHKSSAEVLASLEQGFFPAMEQRYPRVSFSQVGQSRERAESLGSLGPNYLLAMFVVFALIAVPLRSYTQPLVIMATIPFGIVGALWGHAALGYELSLISMMGIIALSGVAVNDAIVLVDAVNQNRGEGMGLRDAVVAAGARRFRPILLTSVTTFFGLAPMIFETSVQARFLIPMAISLGFGVLASTVGALVLIPALLLVFDDVGSRLRRAWRWLTTDDAPDTDAVAAK